MYMKLQTEILLEQDIVQLIVAIGVGIGGPTPENLIQQ